MRRRRCWSARMSRFWWVHTRNRAAAHPARRSRLLTARMWALCSISNRRSLRRRHPAQDLPGRFKYLQPRLSKRRDPEQRFIQSTLLADDGQIVVLGGLLQDAYKDSHTKVPWLGDIPVIGGLFRYEHKNRAKTNLMVFLRPMI